MVLRLPLNAIDNFGFNLGWSQPEMSSSPFDTRTWQSRVTKLMSMLPLAFEANVGQADSQVKYWTRGLGYGIFLTPDEAFLMLGNGNLEHATNFIFPEKYPIRSTASAEVIRMKLVRSHRLCGLLGEELIRGHSNYFIGNYPAKWRTNVSQYAQVRMKGVYPGIDMIYYGNQGQLEYDFVVNPGADPTCIRLRFEGVKDAEIDGNGDLQLRTKSGKIAFRKPVAYQKEGKKRIERQASFVKAGDKEVKFEVSGYDLRRPLVIDPILNFSTYLGGSGFDWGAAIAVDASGNAYVTGQTSGSFPVTIGAYETVIGGANDVFVAKLDPSGSSLIYSSYLGGTSDDSGNGIAVDASGNAYVTGQATGNFPITAGAYQATFGGGNCDAFVSKLDASGSSLLYSSYLGGLGDDNGRGIAVDTTGNAYVTGQPGGFLFPITSGAYQTAPAGSGEAFVSKLSASGSSLLYSSFLGGASHDEPTGIAVDLSGNAYVVGFTNGIFPVTIGAYQTVPGGGGDAFVSKFNSSGTGLLYSSYLGGSGAAMGAAIAVDASGNAYVTGQTAGSFPTTAGAYQTVFGGGTMDAFVSKFNVMGNSLLYSTYLGGASYDWPTGIALDAAGNAYVTGATNGSFPTTAGAYQTVYGGFTSPYISKLNASGSNLLYSSYLGGTGGGISSGIAVDASGNAYMTGQTGGSFPITAGAYQTSFGGGSDAFVAKFLFQITSPTPTFSASPAFSATQTSTFSATPSFTFSMTISPSPTISPSFSVSPTFSTSPTITNSFSPSFSPTATPTATASASVTPSFTTTHSFTFSPTSSLTPTISPTFSVSPTISPAPTPQQTTPDFRIIGVYPDPVPAEGANFVVSLPFASDLTYRLYGVSGELVWSATQSYSSPGNYQYFWNANNQNGSAVSYGAYYLLVHADSIEMHQSGGLWLSVVR